MKKVKQYAEHYSKLAKHTGVMKTKIHGNVSYVENCFSRYYNGKKLQNLIKFGIKIFS